MPCFYTCWAHLLCAWKRDQQALSMHHHACKLLTLLTLKCKLSSHMEIQHWKADMPLREREKYASKSFLLASIFHDTESIKSLMASMSLELTEPVELVVLELLEHSFTPILFLGKKYNTCSPSLTSMTSFFSKLSFKPLQKTLVWSQLNWEDTHAYSVYIYIYIDIFTYACVYGCKHNQPSLQGTNDKLGLCIIKLRLWQHMPGMHACWITSLLDRMPDGWHATCSCKASLVKETCFSSTHCAGYCPDEAITIVVLVLILG